MELPINQIICGDCLEFMKTLPDKCVDLVLTDPPFGIGNFVQNTGNFRGEAVKWNDAPPKQEVFNEIKRISKNRIIWGANYFNCFEEGAIVWIKNQPLPNFSKAEVASCSYHKKIELFELTWTNFVNTKASTHPCERPVELYKWCINLYTKKEDIILDCFAGSGSCLVAAELLGRRWIGVEISEEYCKIARKRVKEAQEQFSLLELNQK